MKKFGNCLAALDYDTMINDMKNKLSSKSSMSRNDKKNFHFFSINGKETCITFNEGDMGFMAIFENGEPVCCGYPQYAKIGAPWGGLGFILLSKKNRDDITEAFNGDNRIMTYIESVIKDYIMKNNS